MLGFELPERSRVTVVKWLDPVVGAKVRFKIDAAQCGLWKSNGDYVDQLDITMDENGIAARA